MSCSRFSSIGEVCECRRVATNRVCERARESERERAVRKSTTASETD